MRYALPLLLMSVLAAGGVFDVAMAQSPSSFSGQSQSQKQIHTHVNTHRAKKPNAVKLSAGQSADVALLARGAKLHREGQVDAAEAIFKEVLAHDPRNVDAFYDLGAIAESRGDLFGALSNYHAALALRPGDKELKDAVNSTEIAVRKNAVTIKHDSEIKTPKISPMGTLPPPAQKHVSEADVQALSDELAKAQAECRKIEPDPVISLPQTDATPIAVDGKTFSLSSRKGEILPPTVGVPLDQNQADVPTLGITPDQFPDVPLSAGTGKSVCPPALTVGANQNAGGGRMRRAASLFLTVGAGAALNMSGLHCPICHMMNGHF